MATTQIIPPPPGFELDRPDLPPVPEGFVLDAPPAAPTSSAVGNTLKTAYKGVVKGTDTAIGGVFSLPDRLHAMGQKAGAHLLGAVGLMKPEQVALMDKMTDEAGLRITPGGATVDAGFDQQTPLRKLALTGQQLSIDRQALIDENIPTDPARAGELKTQLADMGGRVVPLVAMAPAGLPAVATTATAQMSEGERAAAIAEGDTPAEAEARAQAVLPAAAATSVVGVGGKLKPMSSLVRQIIARSLTSGAVNTAGTAAVNVSTSRPAMQGGVESFVAGAVLGGVMPLPEAAGIALRRRAAAPTPKPAPETGPLPAGQDLASTKPASTAAAETIPPPPEPPPGFVVDAPPVSPATPSQSSSAAERQTHNLEAEGSTPSSASIVKTETPPEAIPAAPAPRGVSSDSAAQAGGQAPAAVVKPEVVVKTSKGRPFRVGNAPDGTPDLLTAIENLGGAPGPGKRGKTPEYDGYDYAFGSGAARVLRRAGGGSIDTFIPQLEAAGFTFDSVDEFYAAVRKASDQRIKMAKALGDMEYGAKFDAALFDNTARKPGLKAAEPVNADTLNVGDKFEIRGEPVKVVSVSPDDGSVRIKDGVTRDIPPGTPVYPDKGTVQRAPRDTEFLPAEAQTPSDVGGVPSPRIEEPPAPPAKALTRTQQRAADKSAAERQHEFQNGGWQTRNHVLGEAYKAAAAKLSAAEAPMKAALRAAETALPDGFKTEPYGDGTVALQDAQGNDIAWPLSPSEAADRAWADSGRADRYSAVEALEKSPEISAARNELEAARQAWEANGKMPPRDPRSGSVDPAVMHTLTRGLVGAGLGYWSGDTEEEKLRNAAIGAGLGLGARRIFSVARGAAKGPLRRLPGAVLAKLAPDAPAPTAPAPGVKPLGLLESAKAAATIHPDLKANLEGFYNPITNAETQAAAVKAVDAAPSLDAAKTDFLLNRNPDAVAQATGLELVRRFQAEGRLQDAADVLYDMAVKAKTQGQAIQILATLSRGTPEGMAAWAQRLFGRKLTPAEIADIKTEMGRIQATKSPEVKLARQAQLLDRLQRSVPGKLDEKLAGAMNLAMLLNPKTIIRNVGGNTIMAAGDLAADALTPLVDAGVSIFTQKRSAKGVNLIEYGKGLLTPARDFAAGVRQARAEGAAPWASFKEGVATMATLGRLLNADKVEMGDLRRAYRGTFSSPLGRGLENTLNVVMGGPDRAFYMARFKASLRSQVKAADAAAPTAEMMDRAALEAARAIYRDKNFVSDSLRGVRESLNLGTTFGKSKRFGAGQAIVPFVQVPGALLMRGLEFSPAGFLKAMAEGVAPVLRADRPFNQREFSQAFSKALVGTAGLVGLGYALSRLGILSGPPDPDRKARALKKELGLAGYQINVSALRRAFISMNWTTPQPLLDGDVLKTYDWAQPLSMPLAMGAGYSEARARSAQDEARGRLTNGPNNVLTALLAGSRTLEEQPLLSGLERFMTAAAVGGNNGGVLEALSQSMLTLPGQFVPAAVRQVQQLTENQVYETRGSDQMEAAYQRVAANIPGLAAKLGYPARMTPMGEPVERYQDGGNTAFNVLVNPALVAKFKSDPQLRELYRLWQQTGTAVIPDTPPRAITINGTQKTLTSQETSDLMQFVGRVAGAGFGQLMRAEGYDRASDEEKAQKLGQVIGAANSAAKILLFGDRPPTVAPMTRALIGESLRSPGIKPLVKTGPQ
jgi:hypothetical protein